MSGKTSFDIVLKVAERCNLACSYCYYFFQEFDNSKSPPIIKPDVIKRLPDFLLEAARSLGIEHFNIIIHGGEPLLVKKDYFDRICTGLRSALDGKVDVTFGLQTNGVLVDDEWIELFAKHKINVGVSIDGLKETHDRMRPDKKGVGSYDRAIAGLQRLQAAVANGKLRTVGVLGLVPSHGSGGDFLDHLINGLGVMSPGLNFPRGGWDSVEAIAWNADTDARRDLAATWVEKFIYPKFSYISYFADIFFGLISDVGAEHLDRKLSGRHHIVTVSSKGELFIDDNLLGLDDNFSGSALNIFESTLRDFLETPEWQALNDAIDMIPAKCVECTWFRTCRSGNLYNRYSKDEGFSRESVLCDSIKVMNEEISVYLVNKGQTTVEDLVDRLKLSPTSSAKILFENLVGPTVAREDNKVHVA